jgi:hypothetical protein
VASHHEPAYSEWVRGLLLCLLLLFVAADAHPQDAASPDMSFFVTSKGRAFGGNLGGLPGADAHCQQLAAAVGRGNRMWRAYLSSPASDDTPRVDARDRIGHGPWVNAKGVRIAATLADLHGDDNGIDRGTALTEKGTQVGPGRHDMLTGSNEDGTLSIVAPDTTCDGWTSGSNESHAMLGHHNRYGGGERPTSWNSAHMSRGCSQDALKASLGDGLFYCFAAD